MLVSETTWGDDKVFNKQEHHLTTMNQPYTLYFSKIKNNNL